MVYCVNPGACYSDFWGPYFLVYFGGPKEGPFCLYPASHAVLANYEVPEGLLDFSSTSGLWLFYVALLLNFLFLYKKSGPSFFESIFRPW